MGRSTAVGAGRSQGALDFPTVETRRLAFPESRSATMATVTCWFQCAIDRLERPLGLFVIGVLLLALRRIER